MRHAIVVALLVPAACGPKVGPAQSAAVRAADSEVPGPPDAVSLGLPATPYAAFNAFVTLLDAVGVRHGIEGPASDPAAPPIDLARGRDSVLLLGGRSLGDALDAIVKAVPRRRADPADAWKRLAIGSSLTSMLFSFAERAGVRINVEEAASDITPTIASQLAIGMPPLELDDDPARSVARIVALDSRYEWSESGGRFLVRPRPGVRGRWDLLDRTLDGFRAIEEPAAAAIERIARVLGPTRQGGGSIIGLPATAAADALATRITVDLSGTVTIRDALNAVADATGWMWSARPVLPPGRPAMLAIGWRGRAEPSGVAGRGRSTGPPPGTVGTWTRIFTITLPET